MSSFTHTLIDGDVLLHSTCRGCEDDVDFGDIHILYSDFGEAKEVFKLRLHEIETAVGVPLGKLCFSDTSNWRKDVMPSYKNNRKDTRKPLAFQRLKDWAIENYNSVVWPRLEADDVLGILQTPSSIIVSIDKDLGTVPGWFAHILSTGEIEIENVNEDQARYRHMVQAFMGDKVDGYGGCPGIGIKTATKILDKIVAVPGEIEETEWLNVWNRVVHEYEKQGLTVQDAQENFMVSKILSGDWEYTGDQIHITLPTKQVISV